jgi:benzaldehyde dehydrogenase (NAD)
MAAETDASGLWAGFNVHLAAGTLLEAAALTTQIGGEIIPSDVPGGLSMGVRKPAGVVLGMALWNAPVILGVRAAAVVEAMIAHPAVRRVNFTGSTAGGRIIAGHCAKYLKPAVLELGGKAPLVVLDDADLNAAVNAAAFGAFANSGQICMSTERIIVDESVADEFVARLAAKASALPLGDPQMPFGGVKGSGIGSFGGQAGIAAFTDLRRVTVQTTPRHYPF